MSPPSSPHIATEEALLVKKVLHGDVNAYKAIVEQYQKLVISIVCRMVRQNEDREDLCQEVFLKTYEKLASFKFQSKLSTWIANIAFNHCINFLKKKRAVLMDDLEFDARGDDESMNKSNLTELAGLEKGPADEMLNKELNIYLQKSMNSLSVIQRTVIQLFHEHEFSLEEISAITALPVNTVKSHLFRGRAIVKAEMLKYLNH